jgi:hypothetical protein
MRSIGMKKIMLGFLAVICLPLAAVTLWAQGGGGAGDLADGIVSIRLQPLENGEAKLDVRLKSGASLVLYYDSQLPRNADVLETFWFRERSDARSETHTFTLSEIEEGKKYYFRLASIWPNAQRSATMQWTIPASSKDVIVIK